MTSHEDKNWQNEFVTIEERNEHILKTGLFSDVEFTVTKFGELQSFKAHKLELAKASPVFERMFYETMPQESHFKIVDICPYIFNELLNYIYCHKILIKSVPDAWDLYDAAHKYRIMPLLRRIRNEIKQLVEKDKWYSISCFEEAENFKDEELKAFMWNYVVNETHDIIHSKSFMHAKLKTLLLIVKQPQLNTEEKCLFAAVNKYHLYQLENNLKSEKYDVMMRQIVENIRFLTFDFRTFLAVGLHSPLLTESDKMTILETIHDMEQFIKNSIASHGEVLECEECFSTIFQAVSFLNVFRQDFSTRRIRRPSDQCSSCGTKYEQSAQKESSCKVGYVYPPKVQEFVNSCKRAFKVSQWPDNFSLSTQQRIGTKQ